MYCDLIPVTVRGKLFTLTADNTSLRYMVDVMVPYTMPPAHNVKSITVYQYECGYVLVFVETTQVWVRNSRFYAIGDTNISYDISQFKRSSSELPPAVLAELVGLAYEEAVK